MPRNEEFCLLGITNTEEVVLQVELFGAPSLGTPYSCPFSQGSIQIHCLYTAGLFYAKTMPEDHSLRECKKQLARGVKGAKLSEIK